MCLRDWANSNPPRSSAACLRCKEPGKRQKLLVAFFMPSKSMAEILKSFLCAAPQQAILRTSRWCSNSPRMGTCANLSEVRNNDEEDTQIETSRNQGKPSPSCSVGHLHWRSWPFVSRLLRLSRVLKASPTGEKANTTCTLACSDAKTGSIDIGMKPKNYCRW